MKETFWVCNVCSPARCYLKSIGLATPTECVMSLNGIPRWESEQQASKSVEAQNSTSPNTTKVQICPECKGTGTNPHEHEEGWYLHCEECGGTGKL